MKKNDTFRLGFLMCMTGSLKKAEGNKTRRKQSVSRRRSKLKIIKSAGIDKF